MHARADALQVTFGLKLLPNSVASHMEVPFDRLFHATYTPPPPVFSSREMSRCGTPHPLLMRSAP